MHKYSSVFSLKDYNCVFFKAFWNIHFSFIFFKDENVS